MYIDSHTHLNLEPLWSDRRAVVERARTVGVEAMIVPGADLFTSERAVVLAGEQRPVFAAVGIHPEVVDETWTFRSLEQNLERLAAWLSQEKAVAVGEVGLDYFRFSKEANTLRLRAHQQELFRQQVRLAAARKKPVIVHTRTSEAMWDALSILKALALPQAVFHCFSGDQRFLEAVLAEGYFIGASGVITFKSSEALRRVIATCPMERMMLETDAPYLAPEPHRGKINEPAHVTITGQKLAELQEMDLAEVQEKTTRTAKLFFGIS